MKRIQVFLAAVLAALLAFPQDLKFSTTTKLVIVNVEVAGRDGKTIEDLSKDDFTVVEDGKPQKISVFEFQRVETDQPETLPDRVQTVTNVPLEPQRQGIIAASKPGEVRYRDKRLLVFFFDLSAMEVAEQVRALKAAEEFLANKMTPADLVSIMTFSTELKVLTDFTADRDLLLEKIRALRIGESSDLAANVDEENEDTGAAFTADSTEFDIFNTDRKLTALQDAAAMLASLPEKKALIYFSSGAKRTGTENDSQLRSTINAAIRANVAFYPVDATGLTAEAPLGNATVGTLRGQGAFTGQAQRQRRESANNRQETLVTLAADTGGKAMLDTNDLEAGIVQAQRDIRSYYILGYYSTNPEEDGRYRKVQVKVASAAKLKLEYRAGYFAPKTFDKFNEDDKERQLEEAMRLGDPITDLPVALEVNYFRRARDRYIVPIAVKIPGSEIQLAKKGSKEENRLDFLAEVRDERGRPAGVVRDFIKIKLTGENSGQMANRNLLYDTAFTLAPGKYRIKFVVRENETGKMGTFESGFAVPDLAAEAAYLRTSSVVWASQREPLKEAVGSADNRKKVVESHPLVREGQKLVPSITRVFRQGQEMFVLFEVYEPGVVPEARSTDLEASISLFGRNGKALESEPVRIAKAADGKSPSLPVELSIPLSELKPGQYICQLSVVDRAGKKFAFHRTPLVVLPGQTHQQAKAQ